MDEFVCDNSNHLLTLNTQEKFNSLGKFTTDRHIPREGGGGGTLLYQLSGYVQPQRLCFLSRFGLKTDIDFDHYGLESGMVFKGATRAYKRMGNGMLWSEIRSEFKEPGDTTPLRIPRSIPPPPPPAYRAAPF